MPLERVLEPEVMDTVEEAVDYNNMDHSEVNKLFVQDLLAFGKANDIGLTNVLDLGTGTGLIPIELCQNHPSATVLGIDMAGQMLRLAEQNVRERGLQERITFKLLDAKQLPFEDEQFQCLMSNSIVHHIPEPKACIAESVRIVAAGGMIFVRDLLRPEGDDAVKQLVQTYAGDENAHSQKMFDDSLRAALSLEEIQDLVAQFGFDKQSVKATSDRHWTWSAIKS